MRKTTPPLSEWRVSTMNDLILVNVPQNSNPPRIVRRELNLDFGQFFYPNESRKIFDIRYFQSTIIDEQGNEQTIKATVEPSARLGTLTTFDERVYYCLVELWEENNKSHRVLFSEREIARKLNIQWGRNTSKAINESLNRLRIVGIQWEGSFYSKVEDRYIEIRNPFTILNHLKSTSTKDKGFKAQIAEFGFDDKVLENLNCSYSRPVLFDVVLSFKSPLAQAAYNSLDRKLYGTKQYHRSTEKFFSEDLKLLGESYQRKAIRQEKLKEITVQLTGKPLAFGEVIESVEIDEQRDVLIVKRSESSTTAKKTSQKRLITRETIETTPPPCKQNKVEITATQSPSSEHPPSKEEIKTSLPENSSPLPSPTPTSPPSNGHSLTKLILQVFAYFLTRFCLQERDITPKEKAAIEKTISVLGKEKIKFFINYAHEKAQETSFKPQYFTAIEKYASQKDFITQWEAHLRKLKREEEEHWRLEKSKLHNAYSVHESKYLEVYKQHIRAAMDIYFKNNPDIKQLFELFRLEKFDNLKKQYANSKIKIQENTLKTLHDLEFVNHTQEFFNELEYPLMTFKDWDIKANDSPFPHWHLIDEYQLEPR